MAMACPLSVSRCISSGHASPGFLTCDTIIPMTSLPANACPHPTSGADVQATLDQLWVYPVKSCAGLSVPSAKLLPTGLAWDRHWMVVDDAGDFVSQRELPRMALIHPELTPDELVLRATDLPGMPDLHVPLTTPGTPCQVRVWRDEVTADDMGDAAARWLSDWVRTPSDNQPGTPVGLRSLRLVRCLPQSDQPRLSDPRWTHGQSVPNAFSDGFPLLVLSTASLDGLNQRLQAAGQPGVDMRRFRPNLVVAGVEAHDEDRLAWLWVADKGSTAVSATNTVTLALTKPCARCPIPDVDPDTAECGHAVADALQAYRHDPRLQGAMTFGMNAFVASALPPEGVWLTVGQPLCAQWQFDD